MSRPRIRYTVNLETGLVEIPRDALGEMIRRIQTDKDKIAAEDRAERARNWR